MWDSGLDPGTERTKWQRSNKVCSLAHVIISTLIHFGNFIVIMQDTGPSRWHILKEPPCQCWRCVLDSWVGWEGPLEKEMTAHSSILAWRIPQTEESGRLQSIGSQRIKHN